LPECGFTQAALRRYPRRRNPEGKAIGFIKLPERCANLAFGGPKNNRLYMTSCHSIYALYVEAHGAV